MNRGGQLQEKGDYEDQRGGANNADVVKEEIGARED